ncbi:hypothetical protein PIB30_086974 [Stylosanthes scabra]|uniref:Uncharacterized protein n=1 Tax=Stylosanthes scabra TaxID=79078 RepID=A0ABU6UU45_9FABA|nr:hypothetical protein [Stylosanthes scabra]
MAPQHTSYVGSSSIASTIDRGCTLYVTAPRHMWEIFANAHIQQRLHVITSNVAHIVASGMRPTLYVDPSRITPSCKIQNLNLQRYTCPVHRKRKGKAVSSSSEVPRFKTLFHEAHYKSKLSARKVLPELIIQIDEDILDPCGL